MPNLNTIAIAYIVNNNPSLFKPGNVISGSTLGTLLNIAPAITPIYKDIARYNMCLLSGYTKLNKELAKRGVYIKAKNYYSTFHVLGTPDTEKVVASYSKKAASNLIKRNVLHQGVGNGTLQTQEG